MSLEGDKEHILTGIYHAKEVLFFCIGIATLIAVPTLGAGNAVATFQLVIIGTILTLEGFAEIVELVCDLIIKRAVPWVENEKRKRKFRRG